MIWFNMTYLTKIGLTPGGCSTVHIYTQTPGGSSTVHIYTQTSGGSSTVHIYTQTPGGYSTVHIYTQTPGGCSTVHICTQTIHRTTHYRHKTIHRTTQFTNQEECGPCLIFARYTLAFALQMRKKHGKTSVRVVGELQLAKWKLNI
jgi:ribosomal protein L34E